MGSSASRRISGKAVFQSFIQSGSSGGVILFLCSVIALLIANIPSLRHLDDFWSIPMGFWAGSFSLELTLLEWVNDGLMAVFFFMVGLEIKREMMVGELSRPKQAMLPIFAAVGGMVFPALIYTVFNHGTPAENGWGIPMATDIAFAIAVLAILGKKCPLGLKVFLTALAIVDDLGSIIVLAVFYPSHALSLTYLLYAAAVLAVLFGCNRLRVNSAVLYVVGGVILWYLVLKSGVHSTIAGVLLAQTIPARPKSDGEKGGRSLMNRFEVSLHPWVYFLIMPIFALANAGVTFGADAYFSEYMMPIASGIFFGLVLGKPLGIFLFSWLACRIGAAQLPSGIRWIQILAIGMVGGIGFTMSLFIDGLAFTDPIMADVGKAAIIMTSVVAAILGYVAVSITGEKHKKKSQNTTNI